VDEWYFPTQSELEQLEQSDKWVTSFRSPSQNTYSHLLQQPDEAAAYFALLSLPAKVGFHGKAARWFFLTSTQVDSLQSFRERDYTAWLRSELPRYWTLSRFLEIMPNCEFIQNDDNLYYALYRNIDDNTREWVEKLYRFPESKKWTPSDLKPILEKVDYLLNKTKFSELNAIFEILDAERLPPIVMISLLRATYAYRSGIPNWFSFCVSVRNELNKRKLNAESLLQGLLNKHELSAK
jgi:hypothetical protein